MIIFKIMFKSFKIEIMLAYILHMLMYIIKVTNTLLNTILIVKEQHH